MSVSSNKRRVDTNSLRFRLTVTFLAFAMVLLGLLWILQTVLLQEYYEYSMKKKSESTLSLIGELYSATKDLDVDYFCDQIADIAGENDVFVYIEAVDESFQIKSSEQQSFGRNIRNSIILEKTKAMLILGEQEKVSVTEQIEKGMDALVNAMIVESEYRVPIFLFTVASLVPLGPAVDIISSMLFIVTIVSVLLGGLIAFFYSKRMARPVMEINRKAKQLSAGNYDIDFSVKGYSEIEELAQTLTRAADDLEKSDALQKDLMANVSHDLRTPLTMIKSYAEMIRDISGDNSEKRNEHLQVIIDEADRLSNLVGDILMLSKIQAGTEDFEMAPVNLQKAAEGILNVYRVMESDGYVFTFSGLDRDVFVEGDERRLLQVISNLISNAVRYSDETKQTKQIEISFSSSAKRVRLSVSDNGIGIDDSEIDGVWNRYQRASRGVRRSESGTGLGLSIAREILERHGADYGVSSKPGEGSCFWFELDIMK